MVIIADRHYKSSPGELVKFSERPGSRVLVGSVVAVGGATPGLPSSVAGARHSVVVVTVGFTGMSGGSVEIDIGGSLGGADSSRVRQVDGLPFRTATFIVD